MSEHARRWSLDPDVVFLNHGSFGACPRRVLSRQQDLRDEMEAEPVDFLVRRLPARIDAARTALARFVGTTEAALVPVPNATTGVNAVLGSFALQAGDEVLVTDHAYNACRNALDHYTGRAGARVRVARLPYPLDDPGAAVEAILGAAGARTRLALLDHVTSTTGLVIPLQRVVPALEERGIQVLVDGAHAPGMIELDVDGLGASFYAGNCHKWICAPKGAGFLAVADRARDAVRPSVISHGMNTRRPGRTRLHDEFDWTGTADPTAFLCVPEAIAEIGGMLPGGWPEVRAANRALVTRARRMLLATLGAEAPCPEAMLGALAAVPLPAPPVQTGRGALDPLQVRLREEQGIEVPIMVAPNGARLLRVSAQLYNTESDYRRLARALEACG